MNARQLLALALARGAAVAFLPAAILGVAALGMRDGHLSRGGVLEVALFVGATLAGATATCSVVEHRAPRGGNRDIVTAVACSVVGSLVALVVLGQGIYADAVLIGGADPAAVAARPASVDAAAWAWCAGFGASLGGLLGVGAYQRRRGHHVAVVVAGSAAATWILLAGLGVVDDPRKALRDLAETSAAAAVIGAYLAGVTALVDRALIGRATTATDGSVVDTTLEVGP